jgi:hypothetical protein
MPLGMKGDDDFRISTAGAQERKDLYYFFERKFLVASGYQMEYSETQAACRCTKWNSSYSSRRIRAKSSPVRSLGSGRYIFRILWMRPG